MAPSINRKNASTAVHENFAKNTRANCKAKNIIVSFIRTNQARMHDTMDSENFYTDRFLKNYYILYYPDNYRWDFCIRVIKDIAQMDLDILDFVMEELSSNHFTKKRFFKKIINMLDTQELIRYGW